MPIRALDRLQQYLRGGDVPVEQVGKGYVAKRYSPKFKPMARARDYERRQRQSQREIISPLPEPVRGPQVGPGRVGGGTIQQVLPEFTDKQPFPQELIPYIQNAATKYRVDPLLMISALANETGGTGYRPAQRVGPSGERSFAQIIPKFHYKNAGYETPEAYGAYLDTASREAVINEMARILSEYEAMTQNPFEMIAAYNAGPSVTPGYSYATEVFNRLGRNIPSQYR